MSIVNWGIIGPGSIATNYALGLEQSPSGQLVAIASRSAERRAAFGDRFAIAEDKRYETYDAICSDPAIDAIHIATPHPFHADHALMALRKGKHVSIEKPMALNEAEATLLVEVARQQGLFLREAYMYLHHPQIAKLIELLTSGDLGAVRHVRAVFGFEAGFDPNSRLYSHALAGGGILDVGGYPVSAARMIAGVADGRFADPIAVKGIGHLAQTGVDEVARALLQFENGVTADLACAVSQSLGEILEITCANGDVRLENPWVPGRNEGPSDARILVTRQGETEAHQIRDQRMLFAFEAEDASRAILDGQTEPHFPAMTHTGSVGNARVLDAWRKEVGYTTFAEQPGTLRRLSSVLPGGLPDIPSVTVPGLDMPLNALIMGCDNRNTVAEGAIIWDAWAEAGGHTFDTAFVYGQGLHEKILGDWLRTRGMNDTARVIVKGAHSPYCFPGAIGAELEISLDRLGLERAQVYILHRDNPDIPVGEFVEAIAAQRAAGRIGVWGGSNWSVARFVEAVDYAESHGLEPPRILNNNLSLAVMERPVWPGCVTSNTPDTLQVLRERGVAHISWSSQARGYFLPEELRNRLPAATGPEACFGSDANAERRRRAEALAAEHGVTAHNIATAWVLAQTFPSLALIGPRSPGEIASTLPALNIVLSDADTKWLNLETESRLPP